MARSDLNNSNLSDGSNDGMKADATPATPPRKLRPATAGPSPSRIVETRPETVTIPNPPAWALRTEYSPEGKLKDSPNEPRRAVSGPGDLKKTQRPSFTTRRRALPAARPKRGVSF